MSEFLGTPQAPQRHLGESRFRKHGIACDGCDKTCHRADYYMVHDAVWEETGLPRDVIFCLNCLEVRLGRPITPSDFTEATVNSEALERWIVRECAHGDATRAKLASVARRVEKMRATLDQMGLVRL